MAAAPLSAAAPERIAIFDVDRHVELPAGFWREGLDRVDRARVPQALRAGLEAGGAPQLDPPALLRELDAEGVDTALLVPGAGLTHFAWLEDPRAARALARALNASTAAALEPACGRLHGLALLPMLDVSSAVEEVQLAEREGFRAAWIPPLEAPGGAHPAHPAFRPVWSALCEAGMAAYVHPSPGFPGDSEGAHAAIVARIAEPLGPAAAIGAALGPAMDCGALLMAILADGLLEALPSLRLVFADCGTAWLPLALEKTESALWLCHQDTPVCLEPEAVFGAGEHLVAFEACDGSVQRMPQRFARSGAWGSAGTDRASDVLAALRRAHIDDERIRALVGGNARRVLGMGERRV